MLKPGDHIPDFELPDEDGKLRRSVDLIGKGKLVIYFFPMDFTPGCTREACSFRDRYDEFSHKNFSIAGISADSPGRHKKFIGKHSLPFPLLSDKGNKVRKLFGIKKVMGFIPARVTFIFDEKGRVTHVFKSLFAYEDHAINALNS